jgi:hypothetical protein
LGKGRRNPELGSISDGIVAFMVAGDSAWVKARPRGKHHSSRANEGSNNREEARPAPFPLKARFEDSVTGMKCAKRS